MKEIPITIESRAIDMLDTIDIILLGVILGVYALGFFVGYSVGKHEKRKSIT